LSIAVLINGLNVESALSQYTLFTVGDGLLSQIPALLNSLAAGMIVTRVVRGDDKSLASELIEQLGQLQKVKALVGVVALVFAFIPGMPAIPFLSLAIALVVSAVVMKGQAEAKELAKEPKFLPRTPAVISVELPEECWNSLGASGRAVSTIRLFQERSFEQYGLILMQPALVVSSKQKNSVVVKMRGVIFATEKLATEVDGVIEQISTLLDQLVSERTHEFVDDILTRRTLDYFDEEAPELVSAVVPGVVTLTQLTGVLKELSKEGLSIRNYDLILQAVAESGPKANGERELLEDVREALRRIITEKYCDEDRTISVFALDPIIDLGFVRAEQGEEALAGDNMSVIEEALKEEGKKIPILLVSKRGRKLIQECLNLRNVSVTVLAHDEIADGVEIEVCRNIEPQDVENELRVIENVAA